MKIVKKVKTMLNLHEFKLILGLHYVTPFSDSGTTLYKYIVVRKFTKGVTYCKFFNQVKY